MAYELYLLPAAAGADIEEAGEALVARVDRFDEATTAPAALPELAALVGAVRRVDAALVADAGAAPPELAQRPGRPLPVVTMRDPAGLELTLARSFARIRIPFDRQGEDARAVFDRAFRILAAAAEQTGWRAYDPQDAGGAALDDDGRDQSLLIYLTVMDQLRTPGARR